MGPTLITADRLFDGTGTASRLRPSIWINEGRIEAVESGSSPPPDRTADRFGFQRSSSGYHVDSGVTLTVGKTLLGEVFAGWLQQNFAQRISKPLPEVYSSDLSEFVFAAGVSILKRERPDLMYLSTTDYVQHKAAPGSDFANSFYAMVDRYVGALDAAGCVLVLTADHGMNDKHLPNGEPDVIYLQTLFDQWLGAGKARVILPITDPYVAHHGALGSFATVYLPAGADIDAILGRLRPVEGVDVALNRDEACARFELPADRIGDIVVVSTIHKVLGTARERHDLSGLTEPLRSHGGLTEQVVPMIANRAVMLPEGHQLRNFDIFDVALNRVAA